MDLTLVVMAAGIGSRFGGLKQLTPVDDDGNFIIDYSIYDAIKAGFKRVVFVIQKENFDLFKKTIGERLKSKIDIEYAFQAKDDIPKKIDLAKRKKPWGTVQALLAAKPNIKGAFAVINADDYYGRNAYIKAVEFLKSNNDAYTYANISYNIGSTKGEGVLKRAIFSLDGNKITSMIESSVTFSDNNIIAQPINEDRSIILSENDPVSMNFFVFKKDVFELLEKYWEEYFLQDEEEILNGEVLLPICLNKGIKTGKVTLFNCFSNSNWFGMTYASDLEMVKKKIQTLKAKGIYKQCLWEEYCGK